MAASERMSAGELRAAIGLAGIFGLRMLGLFAILPVFALYAGTLADGNNLTLVGLALGAYGLTQALLQIPFGMWSDRIGRKPVMIVGLVLFALGSVIAARADSIHGVILGRVLQGGGAISAVAMAMAADATREAHRTKVMAIIGGSIGVSFAIAIVLGPWLDRVIGVPGIFYLIGALAVAAMGVVYWLPDAREHAPQQAGGGGTGLRELLCDPGLARLNLGIFVLHAALISLFVVLPPALVASGIEARSHWVIYAGVMAGAILLLIPAVYRGEPGGGSQPLFLGSIALVAIGYALLVPARGSAAALVFALLVFFTGFMVLEAVLPARVSMLAPPGRRGAAIAIYSTVQFLGAFCGGALGGALMQHFGLGLLSLTQVILLGVWFVLASGSDRAGATSARTFSIPAMDGEQMMGLKAQLGALPGVREARLHAASRTAYLQVDASRFDERDVLKLIAGER